MASSRTTTKPTTKPTTTRQAIIVHQRPSDARPMMPREIQTLVLPSQLWLPTLKVPPNPNGKKNRGNQKAVVDSDADDDDFIDATAAPQRDDSDDDYRNRYVPRFDTKTNRCWWEWIEYDLDDDGHELYDLQQIREDAWNAYWKENARRDQKQSSWWNVNPQH